MQNVHSQDILPGIGGGVEHRGHACKGVPTNGGAMRARRSIPDLDFVRDILHSVNI